MEYLHTMNVINSDENNDNSSDIQIANNQEQISPSTSIIIDNRSSPINGPGLAKPISMNTTCANKRIDAALEKNLETIAIQVRRTTTTNSQPSQLTQNDLQLFDSTTNTQQTTREMTPDSIADEPVSNPNIYPRPMIDPYAQNLWPSNVYPFAAAAAAAAHQHPGFYMPYLPPANNALPSFYPPLIDPQSFSAYLTQQQAAVRFFQEQTSSSDNFLTATKDTNDNKKLKPSINGSLTRLSPDLLSDGDGANTNDADSVISLDSIKSNSAVNMPVLEDGLSDSETNSTNESTIRKKPVNNIPSHKQKYAKTIPTEQTNNRQLDESSTLPADYDTDEETDKLLGLEHQIQARNQAVSRPPRSREENSSVLIEGVLFRCRYLGSTQLSCEGNPTKVSRMMQAQEAVERIKAPYGESQPMVDVDLFISTEKIMVLNTDLEDILMDHSLRSISYIADIGDLVVLMAKRRYIQNENGNDEPNGPATRRVVSVNQKMICHVFESDEAQSIAHSIGQAFQVAYVEFLRANGIDDPSLTRDIDYQEVLDQQEIAVEELDRFARKECQKEAIVTKGKNEPIGIVIVESGWGSMLPTVVVANMMPGGPAARGGQLNIGDQIISVNGISMVGLPLSSCQTQIKNMKHLTTVRFVVVPCPPVVEVLIRRPDTKYQLGFSVQNGIICSLLRGGIAERGGVRVGHRIIEINGHSVVATSHERIVSMLANSIGELRMKTMPTQMYRLLTGQETPNYI